MNRNTALTYTAIALVFGAAGLYFGLKRTEPASLAVVNAPHPGSQATPVTKLFSQSMNDAAGKSHALAQWQGKPVLVNFWATWCAPCVQEMPELDQLSAAKGASGIQVIGIGIDSPSNIAEFGTRLKISYPLYVAGMSGTDLARDFGNKAGGLPYTVLIGADGQVKKTYLGKLKFEELKADLADLKS